MLIDEVEVVVWCLHTTDLFDYCFSFISTWLNFDIIFMKEILDSAKCKLPYVQIRIRTDLWREICICHIPSVQRQQQQQPGSCYHVTAWRHRGDADVAATWYRVQFAVDANNSFQVAHDLHSSIW